MLQDNIKIIRKNKGYSQEELASKLHVTRQTISKWETGQSVPDANLLKQLSVIFDVSVSELMGWMEMQNVFWRMKLLLSSCRV